MQTDSYGTKIRFTRFGYTSTAKKLGFPTILSKSRGQPRVPQTPQIVSESERHDQGHSAEDSAKAGLPPVVTTSISLTYVILQHHTAVPVPSSPTSPCPVGRVIPREGLTAFVGRATRARLNDHEFP